MSKTHQHTPWLVNEKWLRHFQFVAGDPEPWIKIGDPVDPYFDANGSASGYGICEECKSVYLRITV